MADYGMLFEIEQEEILKIKSFNSDKERFKYIQKEMEETYINENQNKFAELDTAWEPIHRVFAEGTLSSDNGTYPLNHIILGGENLCTDEKTKDRFIVYKDSKHVSRISKAMAEVSERKIRKGFFGIKSNDYEYEISEEEFEFMMDWYGYAVELYANAANNNKGVLFVAY